MKPRIEISAFQRFVWHWLDAHPGNRPTVKQIASAFQRSEVQLRRILRRCGMTCRRIRAWACVTYAEHLIGRGMKCDAAMALAGYHHRTSFNREYRKWLGCRPSESRSRRTTLLKAS